MTEFKGDHFWRQWQGPMRTWLGSARNVLTTPTLVFVGRLIHCLGNNYQTESLTWLIRNLSRGGYNNILALDASHLNQFQIHYMAVMDGMSTSRIASPVGGAEETPKQDTRLIILMPIATGSQNSLLSVDLSLLI